MSGNGGFNIEQMIPIGLAIAATVATDGAAAPLVEEAAGASLAGGAAEALPVALGDSITSGVLPDIATGVAPETWASGSEVLNPVGLNDVVGNTAVPSPTTQTFPVQPQTTNPFTNLTEPNVIGDTGGGTTGGGDIGENGQTPVNIQQGLKIPAPANAATGAADTQAPLTDSAKQALIDKAKTDPSWWSTLSPTTKMAITGAGALGLGALLKADNSRYGTPGTQTYTGPLSKFSYNPNTYTPVTTAQPTPYQPRYMAVGGLASTKAFAEGGTVEEMSRENAIGANQMYPQADIISNAYASPTNNPVSTDLLSSQADTDVDPYTGAERLKGGGIAAAAPASNMQAIDDYIAATKQEGGLQQVMAKAKAGDYNAMIALNKLGGTPNKNYAMGGGVGHLGGYSDGGRMLKGPGDGMSDDIPASIAGKQPARLADNEFVVPADVVSHLGNGSSDAGARKLYKMMDNVRKARTGKKKQAPQIKADKYMPA